MELGVDLAFLPPHSSNQSQALDFEIYAVQKAEARRIKPSPDLHPQTHQLVRILNDYMKTCCQNNITGAFPRAGIITCWSPEHKEILATVDPERATEVRHWKLGKDRIPLRIARSPSPAGSADEDDEEDQREKARTICLSGRQ
jgi:hypothetical protein